MLTPRTTRRSLLTVTRRPMTLALSAGLLCAVLAGCGASTDEGTTGQGTQGGSPSQAPSSFDDYRLAFAECMRGEGIDMDDPGAGGQALTQADEAFAEAATTCQDRIGPPPAPDGSSSDNSDQGSDEAREEQLAIAACLRDSGVDVQDPAPGENLLIPADVPADVFDSCAPDGIVGPATGGR